MEIGEKNRWKKLIKIMNKIKEVISRKKMIFLAEFQKIHNQNQQQAKKLYSEYRNYRRKNNRNNGIKIQLQIRNHWLQVWMNKLQKILQIKCFETIQP